MVVCAFRSLDKENRYIMLETNHFQPFGLSKLGSVIGYLWGKVYISPTRLAILRWWVDGSSPIHLAVRWCFSWIGWRLNDGFRGWLLNWRGFFGWKCLAFEEGVETQDMSRCEMRDIWSHFMKVRFVRLYLRFLRNPNMSIDSSNSAICPMYGFGDDTYSATFPWLRL